MRDTERWYDSARETIYAVRTAFTRRARPFVRRIPLLAMSDGLIWDGVLWVRF